MAKDRWPELCKAVEEDDALLVWEDVGPWTEQKLYFWYRYLETTTNAIVGHRKWPAGVAYVDLFAGAGVCTLKKSNRRVPGSVLIAAKMSKPFVKILACEKNPDFAKACRIRLSRTSVRSRCEVLVGDCNERVHEIVDRIPKGALTLVFIDPKGLDARFETIAALAQRRRVDFVSLFADAYDINRNAEYHYRRDPDSKLDQVLGPDSGWREKLDALSSPTGRNRRRLFADIYKDQLKRLLEFTHFGEKTITCASGALYKLVYASHHKLGLKFWNEALRKEPSGQRSFRFSQ